MFLFLENISHKDNFEVLKDPELSDIMRQKLITLLRDFKRTQLQVDSEFESLFKGGAISDDSFLNTYKNRGLILYVLIDNDLDEIAGFCIINPKHMMIRNSVLIHYLLIAEKYRNRGLGKRFLGDVMNDLRKTCPNKHMVINVLEKNSRARKLYESLGFRPASITMIKL